MRPPAQWSSHVTPCWLGVTLLSFNSPTRRHWHRVQLLGLYPKAHQQAVGLDKKGKRICTCIHSWFNSTDSQGAVQGREWQGDDLSSTTEKPEDFTVSPLFSEFPQHPIPCLPTPFLPICPFGKRQARLLAPLPPPASQARASLLLSRSCYIPSKKHLSQWLLDIFRTTPGNVASLSLLLLGPMIPSAKLTETWLQLFFLASFLSSSFYLSVSILPWFLLCPPLCRIEGKGVNWGN